MLLTRFPRLFFAHLPTPLEPMRNLSRRLGGDNAPNLWVKRDDCTGLAGGGNKTRKLEFLIADAIAQKSDVVITQGAIQSNHCRQTAAIAARFNLPCHLLLEDRIGSDERHYRQNGNVMLDRLCGGKVFYHPIHSDMPAAMRDHAERLRQNGDFRAPYIIPGGGSNAVGALGYVNAAMELVAQANAMNINIAHIVHPTGSTGTQAGMLVGLCAINADIPLLGVSVRAPQQTQVANVYDHAVETAEFVGLRAPIPRDKVLVDDSCVGPGYGIPADSTLEAIRLAAECEGLLLDPVYSGKGMAGLIAAVRAGRFVAGSDVVFIHTGGAQALPAFLDYFAEPAR